MIRGRVVGLQIRADVIFRLPNRPDMAIEFVIDTGFEGALTLPPAAIAALGLPLLTDIRAKLADRSRRKVNAHLATVLWDGVERNVAVLAMGDRPLLGTALLDGKRLCADFINGGDVRIENAP